MACDLLMYPCLTGLQKIVIFFTFVLSFDAWFLWPWNVEKDVTKGRG